MGKLMKAFFFKTSKDIAFRVTLIIGAATALLMTGIYAILDLAFTGAGAELEGIKFLSGQSMLLTSFSPTQNFGIAISINLIIFIYLEFSQGTIRNKIIAGHSKLEIYSSLYLSGLVYAFAILLAYVGLCTVLGSIFGGFDPRGMVISLSGSGTGYANPEYIIKFVVAALFAYTSLVSFTVFIVTTFRNIGPSIPVIYVVPLILYLIAIFINSAYIGALEVYNGELVAVAQGAQYDIAQTEQVVKTFEIVNNISKCVNPFHAIAVTNTTEESKLVMDNITFFGSIGGNLAWAGIFYGFGCLEFIKRDIK